MQRHNVWVTDMQITKCYIIHCTLLFFIVILATTDSFCSPTLRFLYYWDELLVLINSPSAVSRSANASPTESCPAAVLSIGCRHQSLTLTTLTAKVVRGRSATGPSKIEHTVRNVLRRKQHFGSFVVSNWNRYKRPEWNRDWPISFSRGRCVLVAADVRLHAAAAAAGNYCC